MSTTGPNINPATDCGASSTTCRNVQAAISLQLLNTSCVCQTDNTCPTSCALYSNKLSRLSSTYANPIQCLLRDNITTTRPNQDNKNAWCNTAKRTKGDANNDNVVDQVDYTYWLRASNGGQIPPDKNPDFNGDGEVGRADLDIWLSGRGQ